MESHTLYSVLFQRLPDFRIKYDFICQNDPSPILIYQGRQLNFRYPNHGDMKNSHYVIWPEFEDGGGFTILDKWALIQASGTAKMWIVNSHLAEYHRQHLKIGTTGYITSGQTDIAICEVIELINLVNLV